MYFYLLIVAPPVSGVSCGGRLGNQMSCYAVAWALSRDYNIDVLVPNKTINALNPIFEVPPLLRILKLLFSLYSIGNRAWC